MNYKLSDLCVSKKGCYGIGASSCKYNPDFPQYLRITDISDDGTIPFLLPTSVNPKVYTDYEKYYLNKNDIVFARTGNSTGRNYLYLGEDRKVVFAGFLIKFSIDPEKVIPKYVKYYCQTRKYKSQIEALVTGSTRNNLNAEQYASLSIPVVKRQLQQHIVDTIRTLVLEFLSLYLQEFCFLP